MFKSIVAATAVFASAPFAHAASYISSVDPAAGSMGNEGNAYTVSELKSASDMSDYNLGTDRGWVAGIKLTWQNNKQNATQTTEEFGDSAGWRSQSSFTVYNNGDKTPSGSGLINTTTSSGNILKTYYNSTAQWYVYVTPEMMYQWSKNGVETYTATLTVKETNRDGWSNVTTPTVYTITIPTNLMLTDSEGVAWYPAVGLLGEKVYGEAQYLANQITLDNYTTVKFLSDPVGVTFGDGFAASDNGDGTWGVTMTHSHTWAYSVDGATLTATCGNAGCPVGGSTSVSLTLSGSDKVYDNKAITASADFDSSFKTIFPDAEATISIEKDGVPADTIKDAGEYTVTMTVTGLGDEQSYTLSRTVTISKVVITDAMLSFTPANQTYNGTEQTVTPSVNANGLAATFEVDTETSTTSATERGTYSVTVNGTGNFEGTATATWSIVNTTGTGSTVTESATGSMTASGNDFTLSDSSKLEYDAENAVWYAGIKITWPVETKGYSGIGQYGHAYYVSVDSVKVVAEAGLVVNVSGNGSYQYNLTSNRKFDYLSATTWKVGITPEIIAAAVDDGATELVYTMTAGAIIWGNSTEGDPDGVAFQDYTITIPLNDMTLCDNYGNQAYPALPYVAQIGGKKYLSLEDALTASESGQTVALIAQDGYDGEYVIPGGVTVALGAFGSSDATYVLSLGSVLTSDAECTVSTSETGYGVEPSGEGPYTYKVVLQHVHDWDVVANGSVLTATCVAEACPLDTTTYSMSLFTGANKDAVEDIASKTYDGASMSRKAVYGDGFTDVFPDVDAQISVTKGGESVATINDVGEYVVTMTVTGLGDGQPHYLTKKVVVNPFNIADATVTFNPSSITYDGKEHSVTCAVSNNATFEIDEASVTNATAIGEYTVVLNATGNNFTGTKVATWEIKNTTGSLSGVTSAVDGVGDYDSENNTLTVIDSTALEYSDGAWYAGLTLTWPMTALDVSSNPWRDGSADYVKPEKMQLTIDGNVYTGSEILSGEAVYSAGELAAEVSTDSYQYFESIVSYPTKQFSYLATTTWKVAITPAIVEAAKAESKTELAYTMNAGAFVWEDGREGDSDGVAFADYKIELSLEDPIVFVLGENETHDLGETVLTTTRIKLAPGASVTSSAAQANGAIFTEATGYEVERSESGGVYTYTTKFTHQHNWSFEVIDGTNLVATCRNEQCNVNGNETRMWLDVGTTEKDYDGLPVTINAEFDEYFKDVFPGVATSLTVNEVADGTINNAGDYAVVLAVTGLKADTQHELSVNVKINRKDISGGTLVLSPASTTYNAEEQTVVPSVTVGGVTATLENKGLEVSAGTCTATAMGVYPVTVTGTGNFEGTATAEWEIVNTTGAPTSVTASAAGSMTNVGNDFTLSDSSKLEYDAENKVWYAGITITWPMSKTDYAWYVIYTQQGSAKYVKEESAKITTVDGFTTNVMETASYKTGSNASKDFTYVSTTTWKVPLTPAIIEAARAEEKTSLTYTMNAGAFIWGDDTEGDPDGVAFADYTITIPLEGIKLYDGDGKQVYPKPEGQTIIEDIKDDIGDVVSDAEVAESAKAKIDLLAGVAGEGNEQAVAEWVDSMKGDDAATFYAELAQSEYVEASFGLGTTSLISDESDVEVAEFETTDGGFAFAVTIDGEDIEAARVKAASIVQTATSLDGEFGPLDAERIEISESGEMTVKKGDNVECEFFKIVIKKDGDSAE